MKPLHDSFQTLDSIFSSKNLKIHRRKQLCNGLKMGIIYFGLFVAVGFLSGCGTEHKGNQNQLTSIHIIDRNGFKETISVPDRLKLYFCSLIFLIEGSP